jgi:hypothetical protein
MKGYRRRRLILSEGHHIVWNLEFGICNFPDKPGALYRHPVPLGSGMSGLSCILFTHQILFFPPRIFSNHL